MNWHIKAMLTLAAYYLLSAVSPIYADEFDVDARQLREISPAPGTRINQENLSSYRYLLDPDLGDLIDRGWLQIPVGQITSYKPHAAYIQATRQYGGRTKLGDPGILIDYAAGRPFIGPPKKDDRRAGERIAWNMRLMYNGDSGRIPEMFWQLRDMKTGDLVRSMEFNAFAMRFMHRHVVPPIPAVQKNLQNAFGAFYLKATDAGDLTGTEVLSFIPRDDTDQPRGWVYIPQLERSTNLASFNTRETVFGSDYFADDLLGYSGRIVDMAWKFIGETYVLLPMYRYDQVVVTDKISTKGDYRFVHFHGRGACFPNVTWQVRQAYIVEGIPTVEGHPISKRLMYVDAQTYYPALIKHYNQEGQLWKLAINGAAHPNSHMAPNRDTGAPIFDAASMVDIIKQQCTTIQSVPFVNVTDVSVKDFDPNNLGGGGRGR